jgi:quercetin dioxygenase-like cupin family protein
MDSWDLLNQPLDPHHPLILATDDGAARAVALSLPAGQQLQEHQTHEFTWVIVISGEAQVTEGDETVHARPGFVARFDPGDRRDIVAHSDLRLLLVLAPWPGEGHPRQTG